MKNALSTQSQLHNAATTIQKEIEKNAKLLEGVLTRSQKRKIASLLQQPASAGSYAPASGEIFGILKQMKETFETDLAAAQEDEKKSQAAYEELKAAKEAEIAAAKEQVTTKTQELATTKEKKAQAEQDKADTMETLDADQKYLVNLKEKCALTDKEFEERLKTRQLEMQAVSKAMGVLTSDDAMDLFSSTFSFVQTTSSLANLKSKRRAAASKRLAEVARKYNNPHLMTLAMKVRLDAFEKVKQAIDDMIAELLKQKGDEIKQKDFCVDGFNENEKQTTEKTREKTDLETLIEDLTMKIDELHKAIETLKAEVTELQTQMKKAGEDRDKENKEFQQTVAEQRATQVLLTKALDVLKGFYEKEALLQVKKQEPAGPPPPPGFKEYKKSNAAGGVMSMIDQIIKDAAAMEAEAIKGEEDALAAYTTFVTDTNASIDAKAKDIINKSEEKAKLEGERTDAETQHGEVLAELDNLSQENADLHKACDYILKNFDIRQTARDEEVEALKQAKAILSGSKFSEFLSIGLKN